MKARWISTDDEYDDYDADVTNCVLNNGKINILFTSNREGNHVEGRLSLDPVNTEQIVDGRWIYTDSRKAKSSFANRQVESEEEVINAKVTGKLQNYRGGKVIFLGIWKDLDGGEYDFELETEHA
ncbi:MAG: hypothetical protein P8163_20810 [Candidatus Thiodiazotropha sp.]